MRVLIVDTALGACTACVVEDGRLLGVRSELMTKGHQERLAGMVRDAVADAAKEAGGGFDAIDRIGVTVGPGSFTGLRVGLSFAQGLGAALATVVGQDVPGGSVEPGELGARGDVLAAAPGGGEHVRGQVARVARRRAAQEVALDVRGMVAEDRVEPRLAPDLGHHAPSVSDSLCPG